MVTHTPGAKKRMQERRIELERRNPELRPPGLTRPDKSRAKKIGVVLPERRDFYIIEDDNSLVFWERAVRRYVNTVANTKGGDRVAAPIIFDWAMGYQEIGATPAKNGKTELHRAKGSGGVVNPELRRINKILRHYFGEPYRTFMHGRQYPNCYRIPRGYYIRYKAPMTLTLYSEFLLKVLEP